VAFRNKDLREMNGFVLPFLLALLLAALAQDAQDTDLSECGITRFCLGSTAIDNEPLTSDHPCLTNDVSI